MALESIFFANDMFHKIKNHTLISLISSQGGENKHSVEGGFFGKCGGRTNTQICNWNKLGRWKNL